MYKGKRGYSSTTWDDAADLWDQLGQSAKVFYEDHDPKAKEIVSAACFKLMMEAHEHGRDAKRREHRGGRVEQSDSNTHRVGESGRKRQLKSIGTSRPVAKAEIEFATGKQAAFRIAKNETIRLRDKLLRSEETGVGRGVGVQRSDGPARLDGDPAGQVAG